MAQRHPRSPSTKRPQSDSEDVFVASVLEASSWAKKNQSKMTGGAVVVVLVLLAGWYYLNYTRGLNDRALVELEQIQQTLALGDPETGKVSLAQFIEAFGGTPLAGEARLLLAQLYLDSDQPGQAIETLSGSGIGMREPLGPQIATLRGRALEGQGNFAAAEDIYMDVADAVEIPFQRIEALSDAARMLALQDDAAGAIALYADIIAELEPTDPIRGEYEMRKAEMEARQIG